MKKALFCFLIASLIPALSFPQYLWDVGVQAGASNYLGEMGGEADTRKDYLADLKFQQTRFTASGFARYKLSYTTSLKANLTYLRISGADSLSTNKGRAGRNLHFRNDIFELGLDAQFNIYQVNDLGGSYRYRNDFKAYGFAGIAGFYHNPKAQYGGRWVALQPLKTEGQADPYSRFGLAFPVGIGAFVTVEKKYRIGWELSWRKTFTDYLDDVSTSYADPASLSSPLSGALANRSVEYSNDPMFLRNYSEGSKRGDPTHKDNYLTTTITASYVIRGKSSFYRSKYSNYIFRKNARKKRRTMKVQF